MVNWADSGCAKQLLQAAASVVEEAKTRGFQGAVLLQGLLEATAVAAAGGAAGVSDVWQGHVLAYGHPTYFGVMVAAWTPKKQPAAATQQRQQEKAQAEQREQEGLIVQAPTASLGEQQAEVAQPAYDTSAVLQPEQQQWDMTDLPAGGSSAEQQLFRREARGNWRAAQKHELLMGGAAQAYAVV
jgi:hypothetical protein